MPRRNSPNDIQNLADLSRLSEIVTDKRLGQRAIAKKNRRNRHYDKQFIRNTLAHLPRGGTLDADPATDTMDGMDSIDSMNSIDSIDSIEAGDAE